MPDQEQFDAKIAGQEVSIRAGSLNTVATVFTLMLVTGIAYAQYTHAQDARELGAVFREMVQVGREQNCLLSLPQDKREERAEFCKRITR